MESDFCEAIELLGSLDQLINNRFWAFFHGQFQTTVVPHASTLKRNQTAQEAHLRLVHDRSEIRTAARPRGASARVADARLQITDATTVAASVRVSVRVLRSSKNAA
jgi:hypothetical protein